MGKNLKANAAKGGLWSAIEQFSVQGMRFIIGLIMARLLAPSDYGLIGVLAIFIAISQSLIDSGFQSALIQKKDRTEQDFSTVFIFNIGIGIFLYLIFYFTAPYISKFYENPLLEILTKIVCINIFLNSLTIVHKAKLSINLDFKSQAKASVVAVVLSGLIGIFMAYKNFGVWALVIQTLTRNIINTIILWILAKWIPLLSFSKKSFKLLSKYGTGLLISGLIHNIYQNVYQVIIGKLFSMEQLGYYTRAQQFSNLASNNVRVAIQRVAFPVLCLSQDDDRKLYYQLRKFLRLTAFITFPLMLGMIALAGPLIRTILTDKWSSSIVYLQILSVAAMFIPLHALNISILHAKGLTRLFLKFEIYNKIIISVMLLLTFSFGVKAMVSSHIAISFITYFINASYPKKALNYGALNQFKDLFSIFSISVVMMTTIYLSSLLFNSDLLKLTVGIIVGPISYYFLSRIFKFSELNDIILMLKKK